MKKVTLPFFDTNDRDCAADFISSLVRQGVTFEAHVDRENIVIIFTGGF